MKIITRKQFMDLPPGAICCEGDPWAFNGWFRKDGNCGDSDYFMTDLDWSQFVGNESSGSMVDVAEDAFKSGASLEMHFDSGGRDGCFDKDKIYCLLEDADIDVLVSRLVEGKGKAPRQASKTEWPARGIPE